MTCSRSSSGMAASMVPAIGRAATSRTPVSAASCGAQREKLVPGSIQLQLQPPRFNLDLEVVRAVRGADIEQLRGHADSLGRERGQPLLHLDPPLGERAPSRTPVARS